MRNIRRSFSTTVPVTIAALGSFGVVVGAAAPAQGTEPTCGGLGDIAVHGQHVVGDYVIGEAGIGSGLEWPYAGLVGAAARDNKGAAVPGGPGIVLHPVAPGASFCTDSKSPGGHLP